MSPRVPPPASEAELVERARDLAGRSLGELAARLGRPVPANANRAKGWAGELMEACLGATAGPRSEPDFQLLDVELKTLPLRLDGKPRESTYVCTVPLTGNAGLSWRTSCVWRKLQRVLWIPVQGHKEIPMGQRTVGYPLLWSPDPQEEAALRQDWEELMEIVSLGQVESLSARHGEYLQIRPKAADSRARRWGVGASGAPVRTLPRGFYLRPAFTAGILERYYVRA